ncbi:hypothetical protein [Micromonospora sp. CPCC 206061]
MADSSAETDGKGAPPAGKGVGSEPKDGKGVGTPDKGKGVGSEPAGTSDN